MKFTKNGSVNKKEHTYLGCSLYHVTDVTNGAKNSKTFVLQTVVNVCWIEQ